MNDKDLMMEDVYSLKAYDYDLPEERIALHPIKPRHAARMMVLVGTSGRIHHHRVVDLPDLLPEGSLLIVNDTKVFSARLMGRLQGYERPIEIFILQEIAPGNFRVLFRPWKKIKDTSSVTIEPLGVPITILNAKEGFVRIPGSDPWELIERCGQCPLPPYIKRSATQDDLKDYQTIFARRRGSVAAPTAGLHFTPFLLSKLRQKGHECAAVTLHVADGTFRPVMTKDIRDHVMHKEWYAIDPELWRRILEQRRRGRPVVAIGTTVCRTLETVVRTQALEGWTDLFIRPGFEFKIVDVLLTNFHLPRSSLLMLACAFGGYETVRRAYREALASGYRFYSYGDCMLMMRTGRTL